MVFNPPISRRLLLGGAAGVSIAALAGCSGTQTPTNTSSPTGANPSTSASTGGSQISGTVTHWDTWQSQAPYIDNEVKLFQDATGVTVQRPAADRRLHRPDHARLPLRRHARHPLPRRRPGDQRAGGRRLALTPERLRRRGLGQGLPALQLRRGRQHDRRQDLLGPVRGQHRPVDLPVHQQPGVQGRRAGRRQRRRPDSQDLGRRHHVRQADQRVQRRQGHRPGLRQRRIQPVLLAVDGLLHRRIADRRVQHGLPHGQVHDEQRPAGHGVPRAHGQLEERRPVLPVVDDHRRRDRPRLLRPGPVRHDRRWRLEPAGLGLGRFHRLLDHDDDRQDGDPEGLLLLLAGRQVLGDELQAGEPRRRGGLAQVALQPRRGRPLRAGVRHRPVGVPRGQRPGQDQGPELRQLRRRLRGQADRRTAAGRAQPRGLGSDPRLGHPGRRRHRRRCLHRPDQGHRGRPEDPRGRHERGPDQGHRCSGRRGPKVSADGYVFADWDPTQPYKYDNIDEYPTL